MDNVVELEVPVAKRNFTKAKGCCAWCGEPKTDKRSVAAFCSDKCRVDTANYKKRQGAYILDQFKKARRYKAKGAFALAMKMLDDCIREDRERGFTFYADAPTAAASKVVGKQVAGRRRLTKVS